MNYSVFDIPNYRLLFFAIIILIPISIDLYLDAKIIKQTFISVIRMIIQLIFVGIYLTYVFELNNIFINFAWIFVMISVANISILNHVKLSIKKCFFYNYCVLLLTVLVILLSFLIVFKSDIVFNSRYMIPMLGMVLGNILRCNIVGVDRFLSEIRKRKDEYILYISLGATHNEALKGFWKAAFKSAVQPQLASLATIGLVSLPGMMTGQMIGGSSPIIAVKYQILIMLAIFTSAAFSIFISLFLLKNRAFDTFGRLREDVYY